MYTDGYGSEWSATLQRADDEELDGWLAFAQSACDAADAGIACGAVELVVVGAQIIDVEQRKTDLVRVTLRERPVARQQLLEVRPRMQPREAILAQP